MLHSEHATEHVRVYKCATETAATRSFNERIHNEMHPM